MANNFDWSQFDPRTGQGLANWAPIVGTAAFGPMGAIGGFGTRALGQQRMGAESEIEQMTQGIRGRIEDRPLYEIPEETRQMMELYGQTAGEMRDVSQQALEAAEARTGAAEAPGMAIAREQARAAGAGARSDIMQTAGGSAAGLGAMAQVGRGEMETLRDLAIQNQQYRSQAEQQYVNQLGTHAGVMGSAAQLQGAGLGAMAQQRGMRYESEVGRYQDLTQFDITQLGNVWAEEQARRNREAQLLATGISTAGSLGGAAIGTGGL